MFAMEVTLWIFADFSNLGVQAFSKFTQQISIWNDKYYLKDCETNQVSYFVMQGMLSPDSVSCFKYCQRDGWMELDSWKVCCSRNMKKYTFRSY